MSFERKEKERKRERMKEEKRRDKKIESNSMSYIEYRSCVAI